jgi:hypothetical protein
MSNTIHNVNRNAIIFSSDHRFRPSSHELLYFTIVVVRDHADAGLFRPQPASRFQEKRMPLVTIIGLNHELQWKDATGDLQRLLTERIENTSVDLIVEEASGLPTTVAQRLALGQNKPWLNMDLNKAERILAGIKEELDERPFVPLDPYANAGCRYQYLPRADGIRETEWVTRILRLRVNALICLCGFLHVGPLTKKLEENGCNVEQLNVSELEWFKNQFGTYQIVEEDGRRWCEVRYQS